MVFLLLAGDSLTGIPFRTTAWRSNESSSLNTIAMARNVTEILGKDAEYLLSHKSETVGRDLLHPPGPDFVDNVFDPTNRNTQVLRSLQTLFSNGRLSGTGYLSILPIDQGIEHSGGASFAKNPLY